MQVNQLLNKDVLKMKGRKMNKFKKSLMAGVVTGVLMTSTAGMAGGSWLGAGMSAAGALVSGFMLFFTGGDLAFMPFGNTDAIQVAEEAGVLVQMFFTEDNWDPEPADEYQKAAENNGGSCGGGKVNSGGVSINSLTEKLAFAAASLKNVGIEAIGVDPSFSSIASTATRTKILGELSYLQPKESGSSTEKTGSTEIPGAGSCDASYSVCLKKMTNAEMNAVGARQDLNGQDFGTAGITHAELGLKSVQQAIANDGDSAITKAGTAVSKEEVQTALSSGQSVSVQDLSGLIGTGKNTVAAMKIVSLMNLELAQRLNQGNMLQGATLTIEAARALPDTSGITD